MLKCLRTCKRGYSPKVLVYSFVLFALFLIVGYANAESLFIMGWDGAGMNNIVPLLQQGYLPNLKSFIENGGCLTHIENISCTFTMPNWTEAFTGLTYDQTKVLSNSYKPPVPYEWTIVKAIKESGHAVGWFTSKGFLSNDPQKSALASIALNADDYSTASRAEGDAYIRHLGLRTIQFIDSHNEYIVFLHVNPDEYGHAYGENSRRYLYEIVRADICFGEILKHINRTNTKVIVLSDHGFDEGAKGHDDAPDNFLATDLPVKTFYCTGETTGTIRDVANTILDYFGVDWKTRKPTMRGKSLF